MSPLVDEIDARLREVGTPHRAEGEKRYLRSDLDFYGAMVSDIRAAIGDLAPRLEHDELVAVAAELWELPIHERRTAAILLLARDARRLDAADLPLIERLARESKTWALLDYLAVDVIGPIVEADLGALRVELDRWSSDADFWVRRASLLAELRPIRHGAPMDRFLPRADRMLEEREFFIRKAIGWVLREAGRRRPDEVAAWLAPRTHRASGVTMREAVKRLSPEVRDELMSAYREKRPATAGGVTAA
jgi:3-methyladenine DNA glycosylase AlkD